MLLLASAFGMCLMANVGAGWVGCQGFSASRPDTPCAAALLAVNCFFCMLLFALAMRLSGGGAM